MVCTFSEIPGLAEASIQGQWAFGSTRGALLLMAHPRSSYILGDTLLKHLIKVKALKDMFLVTEVFSCPAYSLYLSNKRERPCMLVLNPILIFIMLDEHLENEVVNLALLGSFPVPDSPGLTAGGTTDGKWWVRYAGGLFRSARDHHGKDNFTPLYMLKGIQRKKRWISRRGENPYLEHEDDYM